MREPVVGDVIDQYELTELLARSGMASIYKVTDKTTGGPAVLKIPHPQLESDVVFFQRFTREEQVGLRLDHPAIVKVLKPATKSRMYIALEYVEGTSIRALLQQRRKLPREQAMDIALQVCVALAYLHGARVVHRDIKPENILVMASGKIKILDFGIALDEEARRLTWAKLSSTLGTPDYMAPEQIGGRRGDERTDVYAVGTLVYEMLTGSLPFEAPNPNALMRAKTSDDPRPPSYHAPGFDPALEAVILKAIARAPRDRHQSIGELDADLRDPARAAAAIAEGAKQAGGTRRSGWSRSRRMAITAVVSLALLALLVWLSARQPNGGGNSGGNGNGNGARPPPAAPAPR